MIIFLYGPDDYRRTQKKKDLIAEFLKKRSEQGIGVFDLAEGGALAEFEEFLENQQLFESAKFAVLENAFEVKPDQLAKILKPFMERKATTILISEKDKPVKALAFLTKKPVVFQEFKNLTDAFLEHFVVEEGKRTASLLTPPPRGISPLFSPETHGGFPWRYKSLPRSRRRSRSAISTFLILRSRRPIGPPL